MACRAESMACFRAYSVNSTMACSHRAEPVTFCFIGMSDNGTMAFRAKLMTYFRAMPVNGTMACKVEPVICFRA